MPYTGTIPYTAQDFIPGQKALAQDITNMSYALARLDQNANNAYCVKLKQLNAENQTITKGNNASITFSTVAEDPLGMSSSAGIITIPFDGIWVISAFINTDSDSHPKITSCGAWFRVNGVNGNANVLAANAAASNNATISITYPFNGGDFIEVFFVNYDSTNSAYVQRGVFSASLIH